MGRIYHKGRPDLGAWKSHKRWSGRHLGEASSELCGCCISWEESIEYFPYRGVCASKNAGEPDHLSADTDWCYSLVFTMSPQCPSLSSILCLAVLPPLLCFAIRKRTTIDLRWPQLYPDSVMVKKLWMVISLMVSQFSWNSSLYKCMVLLLMNTWHSGELVITQDYTHKYEGVSTKRCVQAASFCPVWVMAGKGEAGHGGTGHSWGPAPNRNQGCRWQVCPKPHLVCCFLNRKCFI